MTRASALIGGILLLAAAVDPATAQTAAAAAIPPADDVRQQLGEEIVSFFFDDPTEPVVHLDAAAIDSVGTMLSDANLELLNRIDRAYREGHYGPPDEKSARKAAFAAFVYNAQTAFDFFTELSLQHEVIYSTSEEDLKSAFTERYRNPGLYPIVNLKDARTGFGRFCLQFEVDDPEKREIEVTGEKMKAWTEEIEIDDTPMRVVNIDMKTMSHDRVHVVYQRYSCGVVEVFDTEQDGQPVRVLSMEKLGGQYVRKWGFHRPEAIVLWRSRVEGTEAPPEDRRFLGSAIYFPSLELQLPWFLPDLGFDDLRRFDFPEALLTLDAVDEIRTRDLEWIEVKGDSRFANWDGQGDVPAFVKERFPDR